MTSDLSFYRRKLPSPPAIAFSSKEGLKLFKESLVEGYMVGYFSLAEQFRTQDEPAYCGLSTLTMVLNTLQVDPCKIWKGVWRWYAEEMLDCCISLTETQKEGINFDQFICLARCNSLKVIPRRPNEEHRYSKKEELIITKIDNHPKEDQKEYKINIDIDHNSSKIEQKSNICSSNSNCIEKDCCGSDRRIIRHYSVEQFREEIIIASTNALDPVLIVSYGRKGLNQTGDGHFSPIAGYHSSSDMVLIMDVARFKYPPHWVLVQVLYDSMCRMDTSCNLSRGWMLVSHTKHLQPLFFKFDGGQKSLVFERNILNGITKCNIHSNRNANCNFMTIKSVIKCLLGCLPTPLDSYFNISVQKFGNQLCEQNLIVKKRILSGIKSTAMYHLIVQLFAENDSSVVKLMDSSSDILCDSISKSDMVTFIILIIDLKIWHRLPSVLCAEILKMIDFDHEMYPALNHEIESLRLQITFIQEFAESIIVKNCVQEIENLLIMFDK